jgi:sortase A
MSSVPPYDPAGAPPARKASPRTRRAIGITLLTVATALILGAAGVGFYPIYTDLRANRQQDSLKASFDRSMNLESSELKDAYLSNDQTKVADAKPLTRIVIPKLKVNTIIVQGTSQKALATGAGHYPETPLPGEPGNVAIAGHRTMNGKPFADMDKLGPGDVIYLITPFARHRYEVVPPFDGHANPWVVKPYDWSVADPTEEATLTLTTCHPKGSARERLVIRALLTKSEPLS